MNQVVILTAEQKEALASLMTLISKGEGAKALIDYRFVKQLKEASLDQREFYNPSFEVLKLVDIILVWNKVSE